MSMATKKKGNWANQYTVDSKPAKLRDRDIRRATFRLKFLKLVTSESIFTKEY